MNFLATDQFIVHLLDMCEEAHSRTNLSNYALDRERGRELVRWAKKVGLDLCKQDDLAPKGVDRRLVEKGR